MDYSDDLKNVLHMVLEVIDSLKESSDERSDGSQASTNIDKFQGLIIDLLKLSKQALGAGKKKGPRAFDKPDKVGKTVMAKPASAKSVGRKARASRH